MVAVPVGIMLMVGFYLDGMYTRSDFFRGLALAVASIAVFGIMLGINFIRIGKSTLHYTNGPLFWTSINISNIQEIQIVPRFWFTNKATIIFLKFKEGGGMHGGILISRDMFPDKIIIALINHLTHINPAITLDEGVQKILESQQS